MIAGASLGKQIILIKNTGQESFCWVLHNWSPLGCRYIGHPLLTRGCAAPWLRLDPPSAESACRPKTSTPEALQQAAQGLKGNSMKYRYGGDRCLQCVARWHWDTTQWLPPLERNLMSGTAKRWSDIGGVCGRIIRARSLTQPPVTIYCSPPLSANHYGLIISDIATCPSLSLVPYWQMNSLCPGAH